jgi:hypothetical protein
VTTPGTTTTPGATTTTPGTTTAPSATQVQRRIDDILRRQRELVDELLRLRDDVRKPKGG